MPTPMPQVDANGRMAAPGALALLQAFLNTIDIESEEEQLTSPAALASWLSDRGLLAGGERVLAADLRQAIAFREAMRSLIAVNAGATLDAGAAEVIDRVGAASPLFARTSESGGIVLEASGRGVPAALAGLVAIAHAAMLDGTWPRLKVCRRQICRWVFYDASKNRSGAWCSMAVCGNRVKTRAYRRRRRDGA